MINTTALGRLTQAPSLEETPNGKKVCKFRIACDRGAYEGTDFISIETWRGAEANFENLTKGQMVQVTGKLRSSEWTDDNGQKRSRVFINADDVSWLTKANNTEQAPSEQVPA